MKDVLKQLAIVVITLACILAVSLLFSCKTRRVVEDHTNVLVTDTTSSINHVADTTASYMHKQDSIIHSLVDRIMQYESHVQRLDTIRNDSTLLVVDNDGNVIRSDNFHTQTIIDYRRDTIYRYRDVTDSLAIISRYADSLLILRSQLLYYETIHNNDSTTDRVVEQSPSFWQRIKNYWKHILITFALIVIASLFVKFYFAKKT